MTPIKLPLILAGLLGLATLAPAVEVPEGKAAVLEAVIGKVGVSQDGKALKAKTGLALDFGATIETGNNGRVSIRHADNAVSRLAPNTELTLSAPEKGKKGIFVALKMGLIRFLVGKRAPGETFEVQTANAVAAVKGTDGEVESDGKKTRSAVFESGRQKALELFSRATGKSIFIAPGQSGGLAGGDFDTRELTKKDFDNSSKNFKGLPKPTVKEGDGKDGQNGSGQNNQNNNGNNGQGGGDGDQGKGDGDESFADAISDAFGDAMADLGLDNFLARDERTGDVVAGRIAYDRNGTRTQISSWVTRGDDVTITKATYAKRESGPFKGTSYGEEITVWNTALPEDWASVANRALDDAANLDGNGYPRYFKDSQYFVAGNPQGDLMEVLRDYEVPRYFAQYNNGTGYYDRGVILSTQGFSQGLYLNEVPVQLIEYLSDTDSYSGDPNNATNIAFGYYDNNHIWSTNESDGGLNGDGTFTLLYSFYDDSNWFLRTDVAVLTQDGTLLDVAQQLPGVDFGVSSVYLRDFRGLNNDLSIELTFDSPLFSAPIDLLVIPEIFNQMDFYDLPQASNCPC